MLSRPTTTARLTAVAIALLVLPACAQQPEAKTAGPRAEVTGEPAAAGGAAAGSEEAPVEAQEPRVVAEDPAQEAAARALVERLDALKKPAREIKAPHSGDNPPESGWLVDDQERQYYVEKLPRLEGKYKWKDEEHTQVMYLGVPLDIAGYDDEFFYTKVYRVDDYEPTPLRTPPTPEEVAEVEATYRTDLASVDRLRFQPFDNGLPDGGQWRNGFDLADMNGDGHLDILHGPPRKGIRLPVILLGDGAGNWTPWQQVRYARYYDYGDAEAADFNGDGLMDIALGIHLQGVRVVVNDGKGDFQEWSQGIDFDVPGEGGNASGFSSRALEVLDWNGDGRPDILALGEGPHIARPTAEEKRLGMGALDFVADGPVIYLNEGDGSWQKLEKGAGPDEVFGDSVTLGDFDGDGRVDFATSSNRMWFRDLINLAADGDDWEPTFIPEVRPGAYIRAVSGADYDGDGRDDLALAYLAYEAERWRNGIDVLFNRGEGRWQRLPLLARPERVAVHALAHGDIDGDGAVDLVGVDRDGAVFVFLGDGEGGFVRQAAGDLQQPRGRCRGYHVELADLDADGRDEIVASFADEASAFYDPERCPSGGGLMAWDAQPR